MNENKRKDTIKNILIVFLTVLLILTFFSNTIMNYSLPEIASESSISGSLTEKLNAYGVVESNQSYEVKTDGNKKIDTINVKTGQKVEKGDVLFTINEKESEEVKEAELLLKSFENDYQKMLLSIPKDYASENQVIKNTREDLNKLIEKRDRIISQQSENDTKKSEYNQAKSQLSEISSELADVQLYITSVNTDDVYSVGSEYSGLLITYYEDYTTAQADMNKAESELSEMLMNPDVSDEVISVIQQKLNDCTERYDYCYSVYKGEKTAVRNALNERMSYLKSESSRLNGIIEEYESGLSSGENITVEALDNEITAKQRELESLLIALEDTKKQDNIQSQADGIDLKAKQDEIDEQKKKLEELRKKNGEKTITAGHKGTVSQILVQSGDTTIPDTPLAIIDISDEGYTMTISVEAEKTKKIKLGVSADVMNDWSGTIKADLIEMKNDSSNKKNRLLKFAVSGDVESGQTLSISIPCSTNKYDTIIPKSAVNEDQNGKFVLVVKSKSSPLGNRYFAERVDIEVIASDEISSAVTGSLGMGDYVITTSSKPIKSGDQVKMKD